MSDSATIIHDGNDTHRLQITHRDWMLLWGPGFSEGPAFSTAFGVFDNYTVARGIPKDSRVERDGNTLHQATTILLAAIKRDFELLRYDYSYKIADDPRSYGGGQGILVGGRTGLLSLQPKGYCSITFLNADANTSTPEKILDLRNMNICTTYAGPLKVFRRKATILWLDLLPPLLTFLEFRLDHLLSVEHIDRVTPE